MAAAQEMTLGELRLPAGNLPVAIKLLGDMTYRPPKIAPVASRIHKLTQYKLPCDLTG